MRVFDCECGTTIKAANDAELESAVRDHVATHHPDSGVGEEQVRTLVQQRAYDATDS
jgi:predicted small metal-binding protein